MVPALMLTVSPSAAVPLARNTQPQQQEREADVIAIARDAAARTACVVAAFAKVLPERLASESRGTPAEAFARTIWMAGMVRALGFTPAEAAAAVGRSKDTVEHACRVVAALQGALDTGEAIALLGEPGVRDFLGDGAESLIVTVDAQGRVEVVKGGEAVEECLAHAERLIDDLFAAFELVAVRGAAYCREIERRKVERAR